MNIQNFEELVMLMNQSNEDVVRLFQNEGLLRRSKRCRNRACRNECALIKKENAKLGHFSRCIRCRKESRLLEGSFFENCRLRFKDIIYVIWLWANTTQSLTSSTILGVSRAAVYQHYRYIRDICSWKLIETPELFKLGGVGHIVQIDETVVTKRKYHRGRLIPEKWVLGIYDTTLKKGVAIYVHRRNANTLIEKIIEHVGIGSEIWTDGFRGYNIISKLGGVSPYIHKTVNHRRNFVDPITGA